MSGLDRVRRRLVLAVSGSGLLSYLPIAWGVLSAQRRPAAENPLIGVRRQALVIGNTNYAKASVLKNAKNDAAAMAQALKASGFEVSEGVDLARAPMLGAINDFGNRLAASNSIGVFYFAGHGVQLSWKNYLLPIDASVAKMEDVIAQSFDLHTLIEGIKRAGNPMNVIILDACRDNPFGQDFLVPQKGLSQMDAPPGTLLAYATAPGNVASDGTGANGLYTEHLLKELEDPQAKIEDVFKRVRLGVRRKSNGLQIPWESTSLEHDFYFRRSKEIEELARAEAARREAEELQLAEARRRAEEALAWAQAQKQKEQEEAARRKLEEEQTRIEAARREAAERARAEAERRREAELAYHQRLEEERKEQAKKRYEEELAIYREIERATDPAPLVAYLQRYPSGYFSELVQYRLDEVLRRQGEQRIQIASSQGNPYTQGSVRLDTNYKVGDSVTRRKVDLLTGVEEGTVTFTVTEVTEHEVIINDGEIVLDRLGNPRVLKPFGLTIYGAQTAPTVFEIGRRWTTRYSSDHVSGTSSELEVDYVVEKRETVTVPAGRFECYKVVGQGYVQNRHGTSELEDTTWWAPGKIRGTIAYNRIRRSWGRYTESVRFELISAKNG